MVRCYCVWFISSFCTVSTFRYELRVQQYALGNFQRSSSYSLVNFCIVGHYSYWQRIWRLNSTSSKIDRFLIGVNFILGWFGKLLCWKPFTLLSNISYAVYLVQYPVFFYFVGSSRGPSLHTITTMVFYLSTITWIPFCFYSKLQFIHYVFQFDVGQILLIMVLSVLLTLIIDMPFQKIGKHVTEGVYEKIKLF